MNNSSRNEADFFRIATFSTALGFAALGGLIGSLRGLGSNFALEFRFGTILGALIGAAAGWLLWKIVRRLSERDQRKTSGTPRS
jgi:NhaP-type Na+/H+ or K+/H+ antiporter